MTVEETLLQEFAAWHAATVAGAESGSEQAWIARLLSFVEATGSDDLLFSAAWYAESQGQPVPSRNAKRALLARYLKAAAEVDAPVPWFDETFYRTNYPDVGEAIVEGRWRCGYQHYLLRGMAEHRSPSGAFNELGYLGANADVLEAVRAGALPSGLLHHLFTGEKEGRGSEPLPLPPLLSLPIVPAHDQVGASSTFAEHTYLANNTDVVSDGRPDAGQRHWLEYGMSEDLAGSRTRIDGWSEHRYRAANPDLAGFLGSARYPNGYTHFLLHGASEGRAWAGSIDKETEHRILSAAFRRRSPLPAAWQGMDLPVISVIVPTYNPELEAFQACIASVLDQTYPHWQLCLADDASTLPHVPEAMRAAAAADSRVSIVFCPRNGGISAASNAALRVATGEIVALLDHDDVLAPDALRHIAEAFLSAPDVDMAYTDEAKLDESGQPLALNLKPGWSPDLLLSTMYIGHLTAYRRSLVNQVGGFRTRFDGTQDYDLALRMSEVVRQVVHVPKPLYFWRMSARSTAGAMGAKPEAIRRQHQALESTLVRRGQRGMVRPAHGPGHWFVSLDTPPDQPLVSVVIPSVGTVGEVGGRQLNLLVNNLRALYETETYPRWEVVVVHNRPLDGDTLALLANFPHLRLVAAPEGSFNFSESVNHGVAAAAGRYVLLLNDDMQNDTPDLIGTMFARMYQGVGVVGARLLFASGTLQHAGIVWSADGPTHAMIGEHRKSHGPADRLRHVHDLFATTAACMFFERAVFLEAGGLSTGLPVNYNDVEFCLRLRRKGLRVVFNPEATLYHFESLSKSGTHFWELQRLVLGEPGAWIEDPFWNPGFSIANPFYEVRDPASSPFVTYRAWLLRRIAERQAGLTPSRETRFSFIMSVYQNRRDQMEVLADTVLNQTYANFEWVIADDGSTEPETLAWLDRIAADPRVTVVRLPQNGGIMAGYGAAFQAASGDYVIPIDADDFLTLDCLHVLASTIEAEGSPDVVYSDEDKGNEAGDVMHPLLKPDWDPVLLANICYVCHICAIKRETAEAVGAYRDLLATWSHDWDTLMRVKRAGGRIVHVPEVLYAWRIHPGSTASIETGTKPKARNSQRHVVEQDLRLTGRDRFFDLVNNSLHSHEGAWRLLPRAEALPPVAVLLCPGPDLRRTATAIDEFAALPRPPGTSVLLVGEGSTAALVAAILPESAAALWPDGAPQSFLSMPEAADAVLSGGCIAAVLDVEGRPNRDWILEGAGMFAAVEDVALVGGQVFDSDDSVLWRGGYAGFAGAIGSPEFGMKSTQGGYYGLSWCQRLCDGVPSVTFFADGALLKQVADTMPGEVSTRRLAGALAVGARAAGKRAVYTPFLVTRVEQPAAVWPIVKPGAEAVFDAGPVYYSPAFSRTIGEAYALR